MFKFLKKQVLQTEITEELQEDKNLIKLKIEDALQ